MKKTIGRIASNATPGALLVRQSYNKWLVLVVTLIVVAWFLEHIFAYINAYTFLITSAAFKRR